MNEKFQKIVNKKFAIIFLLVSLILSTFVLYTPKPVAKDLENKFSAIRAQEHIEVISRSPHSYYDRVEHEEVRQYLINTLTSYLGAENVFEQNYTITETLEIINKQQNPSDYDPDKLLYDIQNVYGVLKGENSEGILLLAHYDSRGHIGRFGEMGRSYGAMDDGYGVSAILEMAYILKDLKPKNSVYFLFTDAEEVGLYGSLMAANDQEFMKNIKFVMNLESRGRYGATYMFETSSKNEKVIDLYKHAKLPVTYSMATAVYGVMPNFTDFTPFVDVGMPGLNFATLAGLDNYHSPLDRYEYIDVSSIQHMGVQVEPIVREFISNEKYISPNYFEAKNDQVFFTLFAGILISYSKTFAIIFAIMLLIAFSIFCFFIIKNKTIDKKILTKILPFSLITFISMIVVGLLYSYIVAFIGKVPFNVTYTRVSNMEFPTFILITLLTIILVKLINKTKANNVLIIGIAVNLLLTILTTFLLEGASFLFAFTTLFGMISLLSDKVKNNIARKIILGISYTFMFFLIIPLLYSFYMALTVGGVVVLTVLLSLNGAVTLPTIIKQFELK